MKLNIDPFRKKRGLTVEALAEMVGMSHIHLHAIKSGRKRWNEDHLLKLSNALQCTPAQLLGEESELAAQPVELNEEQWKVSLAAAKQAQKQADVTLSRDDFARFTFQLYMAGLREQADTGTFRINPQLAELMVKG